MPKYRYVESDFSLLVNITAKILGDQGEPVAITTASPFNLKFFQKGHEDTPYIASYDGVNQTNCKIIDESNVVVFFDHTLTNFVVGQLFVEIEIKITDHNYKGDNINNVKRLYSSITLTDEPDLDNDAEDTFNIEYLPILVQGMHGDAASQQAISNVYATMAELQSTIEKTNSLGQQCLSSAQTANHISFTVQSSVQTSAQSASRAEAAANEAKQQAEKAQQKAAEASRTLDELKQTLNGLPDSQAYSAMVAQHEVRLNDMGLVVQDGMLCVEFEV